MSGIKTNFRNRVKQDHVQISQTSQNYKTALIPSGQKPRCNNEEQKQQSETNITITPTNYPPPLLPRTTFSTRMLKFLYFCSTRQSKNNNYKTNVTQRLQMQLTSIAHPDDLANAEFIRTRSLLHQNSIRKLRGDRANRLTTHPKKTILHLHFHKQLSQLEYQKSPTISATRGALHEELQNNRDAETRRLANARFTRTDSRFTKIGSEKL